MDPQDKNRFEIQGKSSVKYHLRANHQVEAKRWYWALNNAIQWTKDEDREEQKRLDRANEALKQAKVDQDRRRLDHDAVSIQSSKARSTAQSVNLAPPPTIGGTSTAVEDDGGASAYEPSVAPATRMTSHTGVDTLEDDDADADDDDDDSQTAQPIQKDALNITAQSLKLQLDLLAQVSNSLAAERRRNPELSFSDPTASQAISAYETAVGNLKGLIGDFLRIANDRDAYWQYRLDREANIRRMWEESMAKVAKEQEVLESKIGEAEDKRKRTKRALRDALENLASQSVPTSPKAIDQGRPPLDQMEMPSIMSPLKKKSTIAEMAAELSESDEEEEEFFDAVDAGEVEVVSFSKEAMEHKTAISAAVENLRESKQELIKSSYKGYEEGIRTKLAMDEDNRPKISLWVCSIN